MLEPTTSNTIEAMLATQQDIVVKHATKGALDPEDVKTLVRLARLAERFELATKQPPLTIDPVIDDILRTDEAHHSTAFLEMMATRAKVTLLDERIAQLTLALRNVRQLALRLKKKETTYADHLIRFCAEVGVTGNILRDKEK